MTSIKLRRKLANMPDEGRNIKVIWEDLFNPLITPALENAKLRAQTRAENMAAKTTIRAFVTELNTGSKIDFEGTVNLP